MLKAKIKRLDSAVELPKYQTAESAGFDIASNIDCIVEPGQIAKIPTGLIVEAPAGHFLMIAARGSTAAKKGLKMANAIGIIDRDFAGPNDEIFLPMHNFTNQPVELKKGERIAQGVFVKVDQAVWEEQGSMREKDRGGYGSTGGYEENSK